MSLFFFGCCTYIINLSFTIPARPSIDRRISVYPQTMYTCSNPASFSMTTVLSEAPSEDPARCPAAVLRLFRARLFGSLPQLQQWEYSYFQPLRLQALSRAVLALLSLPGAFSTCNKMSLCSSFSLRTIAEPFDRSPDIRYTSFASFAVLPAFSLPLSYPL